MDHPRPPAKASEVPSGEQPPKALRFGRPKLFAVCKVELYDLEGASLRPCHFRLLQTGRFVGAYLARWFVSMATLVVSQWVLHFENKGRPTKMMCLKDFISSKAQKQVLLSSGFSTITQDPAATALQLQGGSWLGGKDKVPKAPTTTKAGAVGYIKSYIFENKNHLFFHVFFGATAKVHGISTDL